LICGLYQAAAIEIWLLLVDVKTMNVTGGQEKGLQPDERHVGAVGEAGDAAWRCIQAGNLRGTACKVG
jgi:hypothetical protein